MMMGYAEVIGLVSFLLCITLDLHTTVFFFLFFFLPADYNGSSGVVAIGRWL